MRSTLALLLFVGCAPPTELDDAVPLEITVSELPEADTHVPWTGWLTAEGGVAPYRWTVDGDLPPGIELNPAGALTGIPVEKGTWPLTLTVADDDGASDQAELDITVKWSEGSVGCGRSKSGTFRDAAAVDFYDVDWGTRKGWTAIEIPLPDPEITSIQVAIGDGFFDIYQGLPGTQWGDQDLDDYTYRFAYPGYPLVIDLGSYPDLPSYRAAGDPIQLVIAASEPGPWNVSTTCTSGPVIQDSPMEPARIGDPLTVNYSVYGDQFSVSWSIDGALPSWASFEPESGKILGTAQETGTWEYLLSATDTGGETGEIASGFGVYEHVPVTCDTPITWTPTEGYYDGVASSWSDPDGYRVFELPLPPEVSAVTAWYDSPGGGEVGLVAPGDPTWYPTGPTDSDFNQALFSVSAAPGGFPGISDYHRQGSLVALAWDNFGGPTDATFWFECDLDPRPDLPALPVVLPGTAESWDLPAVGGTPAYSWSATGLPTGVTLDQTGRLEATSAATAGTSTVDLVLTDALGAQTTTPLPLYVGDSAACQGATPVACGDHVPGGGTSDVYCLESRTAAAHEIVAFTLTPTEPATIDGYLVPPGGTPEDPGNWILRATFDHADAAAIDRATQPPLAAWTDQPMFLQVAGGAFELQVDCY